MANENTFLIYALIMGIFITFVYDILRIFRRIFPHGKFLVSFEDLCFWLYCAIEVFLLMYHESDGTLRWFAVFGAMVGMFAYKKLVSPFFVKYVTFILQKIVDIIIKIGKVLCKPLWFVFLKIQNAVCKAKNRAKCRPKTARRILKKKLTFLIKMLKMTV